MIVSTVTSVMRAACAIVMSSRRTPIQTLPLRSATAAWKRATSGWIAGRSRIGSPSSNGLSITRQSLRWASTSEPRIPRSGMNGTPFSAACRPAWIAGQVESRIVMRPRETASRKRGARPYSPSDTADASTTRDAAGADQQVGLQAGLRHGDQLQVADASPDQRAHGCHGAARVVRGHRQAGSVGDPRGELLDGLEASAHVEEGI